MKRALLAIVFVVGLTASAGAQTVHPCDAPVQTAPTRGSKIGWCHDLKDVDGLAFPLGAVSFILRVNTTNLDLGVVAVIGSPSATGFYYFEAPLPSGFPRGQYPVTMIAYSAEGQSLASSAVTWQIGGAPKPPKVQSVVK